ncbi:MAG: M48 family metalloprotease, partial [Azoarcus sp.]|jgi:hypothetical protein|nr:M48 family metalloprotease [Azoarcus sp.]
LVAVLAHEFAHLGVQRRGVGKYGALLRAWMLRALDRIGDLFPGFGAQTDTLLRHFYTDMTHLSRIEEFEADAQAVRIVYADQLGEALLGVSLKEQFLSKDYWPRVLAQSKVRAKPLVRPFRDLGLGMTAGFLCTAADDGMQTDIESSHPMHPTTKERLRALRVTPSLTASESPSSASYYLSPLLLTLAWVFDLAWWRDVRPDWQLTFKQVRHEHRRRHTAAQKPQNKKK